MLSSRYNEKLNNRFILTILQSDDNGGINNIFLISNKVDSHFCSREDHSYLVY